MKLNELKNILDIRRKELKNRDFSYNFYTNVCCCWNKLVNYLEDNNLDYNENSKESFLKYVKENIRQKNYNYYVHGITIIDSIDKLNIKNKTIRIIRYEKDINIYLKHQQILDEYENSRKEYNREKTVIIKKNIIINLIQYGEKNNINDCTKLEINDVLKLRNYCLSFKLYSNKTRYLWSLRDFLSFLYEEHYLCNNYSLLIDKMQSPNKKLPETWNKEEIEKIVNSLSESNAIDIRNKAMALLTIRLGIRFIDVKNLKFENIDWEKNVIKFVQRKTNSYIKLPLPEEVGKAIINYIKNSRPNTKEKFIFVSHDQYVRQLSDGFNISDYLIETYKKAGVDYLSKTNKGIHTFRHALATNMLKSGIPLDIISSTLGHSNNNSSKVYISIDDDLLKSCCLSLAEVNDE